MRPWLPRAAVLAVVLLVLIAVAGARLLGGGQRDVGATAAAVATATPAASVSAAEKPAAASKPATATKPATAAKPADASKSADGAKAAASPKPAPTPTVPPVDQTSPADPIGVDRPRIVKEATWSSGSLKDHFHKHGQEGPWGSESAYDASARDTILHGKFFTYVDLTSRTERLGFYDAVGNRFTSVTLDGERILTHFRPDRGEQYVRALPRSNYH